MARRRSSWSGSLDPKGDPGERRGTQIDVVDYNEDGKPDVVISDYEERVRLCGQQRTALRPRAFDEATLRLRPVALNRLGAQPAPIAELKLSPESPGPTRPPLLRALRLVGVSSQTGAAAEPWLASPPAALVDGQPNTYWSEEQGQGGRGEFATFNWDGAGFGLRALAVVPLPTAIPSTTPVSVARRSGWSATEVRASSCSCRRRSSRAAGIGPRSPSRCAGTA